MSNIQLPNPPPPAAAPPKSLYQQAVSLTERLYSISRFEQFLFPNGLSGFFDGSVTPDPVSILWNCFRLGAPLCHLLNQAGPQRPLVVPDVSNFSGVYSNVQKKPIYHFIVACKQELGIPDEDIFSISEMYKDDMNGFVKIMRTVSLVTDIVFSRSRITKRPLPFNMGSDSANEMLQRPSDNRSKVIAELLSTERKYVSDLVSLQNYMDEIKQQQLLSKVQLEQLFANLTDLLDFQRRFILAMESTLAQAPAEQRIGQLFLQHEQAFAVYEPFCGNYKTATRLALQEAEALAPVSHLIEPTYGLQSYLIKPIQRVCKYPLLLKELVKYTDSNEYPYLSELEAGMESVKRVTERVNEQKRIEENREIKEELAEQVIDFKSLNMDDFGDLLLYDKFPMVSNQMEREYSLFLFERIMLCCKEVPNKKKKKKGSKEEGISYTLKGNIYISSIGGVVDTSKPDQQLFGIQVFWKDGSEMETFVLNCRNIEQVRLWMDRLDRLLETERNKRRSMAEGLSSVRNRMTFGPDYDDDEEIDSAYSSGVSPIRGRRRSDAHGTELATAQASSPNAMMRSRSQGRLEQPRPSSTWDSNPPPPVLPEEYRNRKSSPAAPRATPVSNPMEFPQRGASRPRSEVPRGHAANTRSVHQAHAAQMEHELNSLLMMNNQRPDPRIRRNDRISSQQPGVESSYQQGGSRTSSYGNKGSPPRATDDHSNSYRTTPGDERMNARYSQQAAQYPQQPSHRISRLQMQQEGYQPRSRGQRDSNPSDRSSRGGASAAENGGGESFRSEAEARLAARMQQLRTAASGSSGRASGPAPISTSQSVSSGPKSAGTGGSMIKVKTHYGSDIFVVAITSQGCSHAELYTKIERKIRLCGAELPDGRNLKMRYRDLSGDLVVLGGDDDVESAFDVARLSKGRDSGVVNLFIQ